MAGLSHSLWVEKYRPTDLSTYIGNEHLREKVGVYLESGDVPHLLLYGRAGTGKTTLAKIIVKNIDCHTYGNIGGGWINGTFFMGRKIQTN